MARTRIVKTPAPQRPELDALVDKVNREAIQKHRAGERAHMTRIIHEWIAQDAPVALKMVLAPAHVLMLVDRLSGSFVQSD